MNNVARYPFRIFVSYAHADKPLVQQIVSLLEAQGYDPLWDIHINAGKPFTKEIKDLISRSHLFLPIITTHSNERPWIHQETGFAIALDIPVLPICIGQPPSEMIAEVQGITVKEDLSDFEQQLAAVNLMDLVVPSPLKPFGMVEVAETSEKRSDYFVQYANWVSGLGKYGVVRAQARMTTFAIPLEDVSDPIWIRREGDKPRTLELRTLHRAERIALGEHALQAGCRLIIDPEAHIEQGPDAHKARLESLLKFIISMLPYKKIEVVISPRATETTLSIVGDYFFAETMAWREKTGYVHTVFNSHSPTVLKRIQRFDRTFGEIQAQNPMSIEQVIECIEKIIQRNE
jgi:hypothetical protein